MKTIIEKVSAQADNQRVYDVGGEIIRKGGLVAFPTETVYGLGGSALDADAARKIYAAKGRPSDNPLIIHIADVCDADKYCITNDTFKRLAAAFMPGPLTVVLPKRDCIPSTVTGGLDTVAVRVPSNEFARGLIRAAGVPIAAPSANISGSPSPTSGAHVINDMDGKIDMIIDGGGCDIGLESTIVKIDGDEMTLLRPGGITVEMLAAIGDVKLDKAIVGKLSEGEHPLAPGMKYRHYAPETQIIMLNGTDLQVYNYLKEKCKTEVAGLIVFDDETLYDGLDLVLVSIGERDINSQARRLFSVLRDVDSHQRSVFYIRAPKREGIGLAVYNRMLKACGHQVIDLSDV